MNNSVKISIFSILTVIVISLILGIVVGYSVSEQSTHRATEMGINKEEENIESIENEINDVVVLEDTRVYLENKLQIIRDKEGKIKKPIEYKGHTYIPITELGYFLGDKKIEVEEGSINFKTESLNNKLLPFETTTLDGVVFTEKDLEGYDYTVVLNWSTWCPYCIEELSNINQIAKKLNKKNIQFLGILINSDIEEAKRISEEKELIFKTIKTNEILSNILQTNIINIPNIKIINKEGQIETENIYDEHNNLLLEETLNELIKAK